MIGEDEEKKISFPISVDNFEQHLRAAAGHAKRKEVLLLMHTKQGKAKRSIPRG